jgi:hypothetical protein
MISSGKNFTFGNHNIEMIFKKIVSGDPEFKIYYDTYLLEEYQIEGEERIYYYDIGITGNYIGEQYNKGNTANFPQLFECIECVLADCDKYIEELIVIGLFESIQNSSDTNFYTGFDKWLKPLSKKAWNDLIDFWEGTNKRKKEK